MLNSIFHDKYIDISKMLKNKKPMKLIQFLNYTSKFIFSIFVLIMVLNAINNYNALKLQNSNTDKWNTTKNYAIYEYQADYQGTDRIVLEHELGIKSRKLFELAEKKGAMLIKPSDGIQYKDMINKSRGENESTKVEVYNVDNGNVLQVNKEYLKINPVFDSENNMVKVEDTEKLLILVPIQYKNMENEILTYYKKWYDFKKYVDTDIYNKKVGNPEVKHKKCLLN